MTQEIPLIFWPLLFIQILLFYKKAPEKGIHQENSILRKSPRELRKSESNENEFHHFIGETSDYTGDYRIIRYYLASGLSGDYEDVTLATFATVPEIPQLWDLARKWRGPMSISLFVDGDQASLAHIAIEKFRKCSGLDESIPLHFHLVYPTSLEALTDDVRLAELKYFSCAELKELCQKQQRPIDQFAANGPPKNLLRNIAKDSAGTDFVLSSDVSLLPNDDLRQNFLKFAKAEGLFESAKKQAFVIPAFEMKNGHPFPRSKMELIHELSSGNVQRLHQHHCPACHLNEDFHSWSMSTSDTIASNWTENWQPFLITKRSAVNFDERFDDFDFDRKSQFCEMHLSDYNVAIFADGFLVKEVFDQNPPPRVYGYAQQNWLLFNYRFKDEMQKKYNTTKACKEDTQSRKLLFASSEDFLRSDISKVKKGLPARLEHELIYAVSDEEKEAFEGRTRATTNRKLGVKRYSPAEQNKLNEAAKSDAYKKFDEAISWELD